MTLYLIRAKQNPETWARLLQNPENRAELAREQSNAHAGQSIGYWYSLDGEAIGIVEAPSEQALAPLLVRQNASGAFSDITVTVLMTAEEMIEALKTAGDLPYTPPGAGAEG